MKLLHHWWTARRDEPVMRGGLTLPRHKPGLPVNGEIATLVMPDRLVLPLLDYHGRRLLPVVSVGQRVDYGESLAPGLIASASGSVIAIEPRPVMHPSGRSELCVVIRPDENGTVESAVHEAVPELTEQRLATCGVTGLGGAGFDTASKVHKATQHGEQLDTLLINAVECEPMISCDESLMMCHATEIIDAIASLMTMTHCKRCVIAIENDKHAAIAALRQALDLRPLALTLQPLAPVYPAGAERQLVERITGQLLFAGERPTHRGILCINVATALAARQSQLGFPMTSRIVTLAGRSVDEPVNVRVRFGTSVAEVLRQTGNKPSLASHQVRTGGPLSGFDLASLEAPVTATTNSIIVQPVQPTVEPLPCIRCDRCSDVCPAGLLPQQLLWYARAEDLAGSRRFGLDSCIECGCCDLVCPSGISLTQTFRHARDSQREQRHRDQLADAAELRFHKREDRLAQRQAARERRRQDARAKLIGDSDAIGDALARARRRRQRHERPGQSGDHATPSHDGDS
ncbi:MAG: electron transport complex subunit RsxC [Granulosicoccus sp.]|nr:electron transport complex subunit RsxC [Granulosicoccus sp.]